MSRRILVACYEPPGYGGASTATYALYERLRAETSCAAYVSLVDGSLEPFLRERFGDAYGNPRALPDVHTHVLARRFHDPQPRLAELVRTVAPDVVLAVGYIAALVLKHAAPDTPLVFLTAGCDQIDAYLARYGDATAVLDALRTTERPMLFHALEREAVERADLVVAHAPLVHELLRRFYPTHAGKLYPDVVWMAEWIHGEAARHADLARPFDERDVDLLFVASRWNRPEKNLPLVRAIVAGCPELRSHVAGLLDDPLGGAVAHGLVASRRELFALMGRARVVVGPSAWDAAPGILFEAAALGANVVTSPNSGNWPLCHPDLLVEPYTADAFIDRARRAVRRPYASRVDAILGARSYRTLVDILAVV
ncbi:hypothetical protein J421_0870 [Gemmatirosa kalamazoonensis]|uniref:Glycosyl transferase group 1 n=1 Tax=Gemmatirosa kalamazoonensis TaxID=861299 RepID=W0RD86_9BACT|nr:glycosyltransferase family 4 protein [Gemmatirosa kalamazoonensis]AHG88407.1 hypothetical protein J421_0870 [Gemmatirosa kalamazoonensis]